MRNVVVFGAGGPLGSQLAEDLTQHYTVRLTDIAPAEELAQRPPQSPGAPLPKSPSAPHTWEIVDVRDADQVMAACAGMDAIINVSVVRHDPADAFRVNTLGAFNVMRAAVAHGIHRVVHTGPFMLGERVRRWPRLGRLRRRRRPRAARHRLGLHPQQAARPGDLPRLRRQPRPQRANTHLLRLPQPRCPQQPLHPPAQRLVARRRPRPTLRRRRFRNAVALRIHAHRRRPAPRRLPHRQGQAVVGVGAGTRI
ncbi:MAG: NAD-dependent epimerase/dehydratase family protein [Caldilineaceae bacterium]